MFDRPPYRQLTLEAGATSVNGMRRWRSSNSELVRMVSLLPPLLVLFNFNGAGVIGYALIAGAVTLFWQFIFTRLRNQQPGADLLTTTLVFTLLLPPGYAEWQLALGISFGVVVGEQIFGGRGYSFLHPVIAGLAFLFYSFDAPVSAANHAALSVALLPGLVLLLYYRCIDWRTLTSLLLGALVITYALGQFTPTILPGSLIIAAVLFAVLDPAVGTITRAGRFFYGALTGTLIALLDLTFQSLEATVYAALLGSVAAPLIDSAVIHVKTRLAGKSHG